MSSVWGPGAVLIIVMAPLVLASSKSPVPGFGPWALTEPALLAPQEKPSTLTPGITGVGEVVVPSNVRNILTAACACEVSPKLKPMAEAIIELQNAFIFYQQAAQCKIVLYRGGTQRGTVLPAWGSRDDRDNNPMSCWHR
jgi:hypothetical protein